VSTAIAASEYLERLKTMAAMRGGLLGRSRNAQI
jgi:hypothetical protein